MAGPTNALVKVGPQILREAGQAIKQSNIASALSSSMRGFMFPNSTGFWGGWPRLMPSSDRFDYETKAGSPEKNSIVMDTVQWIMRAAPGAPLTVRQQTIKKIKPNHRLASLIRRPNAFYGGELLMQATFCDFNIT